MIDLVALTAPTWVETAGLGTRIDFGCIPLGPGDFDAHASVLFGLIAGVGGVEKPAREPNPADLQHLQIIACLTVRQMRKPGGEAQPVRFMLAEADEDPANGRLWVARLPMQELGSIAGAGIGQYAEAAARAARFRNGSTADSQPGRDGETVRADPGPVGGAPE